MYLCLYVCVCLYATLCARVEGGLANIMCHNSFYELFGSVELCLSYCVSLMEVLTFTSHLASYLN